MPIGLNSHNNTLFLSQNNVTIILPSDCLFELSRLRQIRMPLSTRPFFSSDCPVMYTGFVATADVESYLCDAAGEFYDTGC